MLLSGGLDSATAAAIARAEGFELTRCRSTTASGTASSWRPRRRVARAWACERHVIVKIDLTPFGGSALTAAIDVPKGRSAEEMAAGIPVTYVPARNTVFLSLALAYAEVVSAADIFIGVNAIDYSGYPDCRPEYIAAFERLANLATKAGVEGTLKFKIHTPLMHWTKAEIIRRGTELGVDYGLTHSCYDPDPAGTGCGRCDCLPAAAQRIRRGGPGRPAAVPHMKVAEIYRSVQGEGFLTGTTSVFVRASGCNLRCWYCDTPYASWLPEGEDLSVDEIVARVERLACEHVVLTGGEPMLFAELIPLTAALAPAATCTSRSRRPARSTCRVDCDLMSISPKLANSTPSPNAAGTLAGPPRANAARPRRDPPPGGRICLPVQVRRRRAGRLRRGRSVPGRLPQDRPPPGHADAARHRPRNPVPHRRMARAVLPARTACDSARGSRSSGSGTRGGR